jgi:hypothetical protein
MLVGLRRSLVSVGLTIPTCPFRQTGSYAESSIVVKRRFRKSGLGLSILVGHSTGTATFPQGPCATFPETASERI